MRALKGVVVLVLLLSAGLFAQQSTQQQTPDQMFLDDYVEFKAVGVPRANVAARSAQGYATARTAAITQAQEGLASQISAIRIDSNFSVSDSALGANLIRSAMSTVIQRGGQIVAETSVDEYSRMPQGFERVELTMRLPLRGTGGVMRPLIEAMRPEIIKRQDEMALPVFQPVAATSPAPVPAAPAPAAPAPAAPVASAPVAAAFDALIVRVPSGFKPSTAPKIMSDKGEILFSIKDIAPDILLSRGVAQYTNNEAKAKVILETMGARAIMEVNGGLRTDTDAEVSGPDASRIFNANKVSSMLSRGRVVFLVARPL